MAYGLPYHSGAGESRPAIPRLNGDRGVLLVSVTRTEVAMSEYLWFDIFAYIGMTCVASTVLISAYIIGFEFRLRRREDREMREFNRQINSLSKSWDWNRDA
jgi:hypothetical protein